MNKVHVRAERVGTLIRVTAGDFHAEFPEADANRGTIGVAAKMLLEKAAGFSDHDVFVAVLDLQMSRT